jgi:hypothetical protein
MTKNSIHSTNKSTSCLIVALLAAGVTLLLVFTQGAVLKALQAGKQHINQIVLEPEILVSNKCDDVQIAVRIVPARDLEDFRFDDAMGVVLDPLGLSAMA